MTFQEFCLKTFLGEIMSHFLSLLPQEQLREAQRQAEEEEERMKELERQAEEEAMQRLIEEREAADRQRRRLQEEKEAMEEAEKLKL